MRYVKIIEDVVGLFDVALSFASDAQNEAMTLLRFAEFYGAKCYYYQDHLVSQIGLSIRDVMSQIYDNAPTIVILNSPLYGKSKSTRLELRTIRAATALEYLVIVELGGRPLEGLGRDVSRHDRLTDQTAIAIMSRIGSATTSRPRRLSASHC